METTLFVSRFCFFRVGSQISLLRVIIQPGTKILKVGSRISHWSWFRFSFLTFYVAPSYMQLYNTQHAYNLLQNTRNYHSCASIYTISLIQIQCYAAIFHGVLLRISPATFLQLKIQLKMGRFEPQTFQVQTELSVFITFHKYSYDICHNYLHLWVQTTFLSLWFYSVESNHLCY